MKYPIALLLLVLIIALFAETNSTLCIILSAIAVVLSFNISQDERENKNN